MAQLERENERIESERENRLAEEKRKAEIEKQRQILEKQLACPVCYDPPNPQDRIKFTACKHVGHASCTQGYIRSEVGERKY